MADRELLLKTIERIKARHMEAMERELRPYLDLYARLPPEPMLVSDEELERMGLKLPPSPPAASSRS